MHTTQHVSLSITIYLTLFTLLLLPAPIPSGNHPTLVCVIALSEN